MDDDEDDEYMEIRTREGFDKGTEWEEEKSSCSPRSWQWGDDAAVPPSREMMNRDCDEGMVPDIGEFVPSVPQMDVGNKNQIDDLQKTVEEMMSISPMDLKCMDRKETKEVVDFLHECWCDEQDVLLLQRRNSFYFGKNDEILHKFRHYSSLLVTIQSRMEILYPKADVVEGVKSSPDGDERKNMEDQIGRTSANVMWGYESMIYTYRQKFCNNPDVQASLPALRIDSFFMPVTEDDLKPHQKLLRYLLMECSRRGYRKQKTALFAPKFTEEGNFTRTFVYDCEIEEFIYDALHPYRNHEWMFAAMTERASTPKACQNYLENCREDELPVLCKDRTKFSFRNGLYDAGTNVFYSYGTTPVGWDSTLVCCNYIDKIFDDNAYQAAYELNHDPMDIPTPNIQRILDSQEFNVEVCRWAYASMGRMVYDIGKGDNWQFFPFFKGTAGSGKSTLLRLAAKFYDDIDVGNLMSEGQKTFSIEHLYEKYVFFCYDVDDKMNFSLTRWNQMVSGETVAIERKFKVPIVRQWTAQGAFAGNSYPPWIDQAGNVSRRMLIFLFTKVVMDVDTNLFGKCMEEMPAFMKKCVACYLQLKEKHGTRGIWDQDVLPEYFHTARGLMQSETNPLQSFLQSEHCTREQDAHIAFGEFRAAYMSYCDDMRLQKKKLTDDFCAPIFHSNGIKTIPASVSLSDTDLHYGYSTKYMKGVRLS